MSSGATTTGTTGAASQRVIHIRPSTGWKRLDLGEVWQAREVLMLLAQRDVKVRYKQTALGAAWAMFQPAIMTLVFTLILGRVAGLPAGDVPYPLYIYTGMLAWVFFSNAVTSAGNSVIATEALITKVYFPRLVIPFAAVGAALVDLVIASLGLIVLMFIYQIPPTWSLLLVPVMVGLLALLALGLGSLLSALMVAFRDVRYVLPFLIQLMLFATPAIYMVQGSPDAPPMTAAGNPASVAGHEVPAAVSDVAPDKPLRPMQALATRSVAHQLLDYHPLNGVIASFRATLLGRPIPWRALGISSITILIVFVLGTLGFRRFEDSFADII